MRRNIIQQNKRRNKYWDRGKPGKWCFVKWSKTHIKKEGVIKYSKWCMAEFGKDWKLFIRFGNMEVIVKNKIGGIGNTCLKSI